MRALVGRRLEKSILTNALISNRPELIAVYGRRRVGKTFLVREVYKNNIIFEFSGIHKVPLKQQLNNFHLILSEKESRFEQPSNWIEKNVQNGAQIDLLIDRDDNVINLCEMKFSNAEFAIDKKYAQELTNKVNTFISGTKTKKSVFVTFITTYGLVSNKYNKQIVQNELTMNQLFIDV